MRRRSRNHGLGQAVSSLVVLSGAVCIAPACSELPAIAPNECGNGVLEEGEDCDTYAGASCHPPGTANECRFRCSLTDPDAQCPEGRECGINGVCYEPAFRCTQPGLDSSQCPADQRVPIYQPWGEQVFAVTSASLTLADLDGDGRKDLFTMGNAGAFSQALPRVLFLDEAGGLRDVFDPLVPIACPVAVKGGGTDRTDPARAAIAERVVFATEMGIGTFVATPDHAVVPIAYPNQELPAGMSYRIMRIRGTTESLLQEGILLFLHTAANDVVLLEQSSTPFQTPSKPLADMLDPPGAANVIDGPNSPCEEGVVAFHGDSAAYLIEVCDTAGRWAAPERTLRPVAAVLGHTIERAPLAADLDNDGHLDLIMADETGVPHAAFGRGDGSFAPTRIGDPEAPSTAGIAWPVQVVVGTCPKSIWAPATSFPLAIGDLNHDGKNDWVSPKGVLLVSKVSADPIQRSIVVDACPANGPVVGEWSIAKIAEFTGDSFLDLVAGFSTGPGLDFLTGTGRDLLNRVSLGTEGPTTQMVVGDFDGDAVDDVAFGQAAVADTPSTPPSQKLSIAFGNRGRTGNLTDTVEVGRFKSIVQLEASNYAGDDSIDDIGVLSGRDDAGLDLTIFVGSRGRRPIAPLGLSRIVSEMSSAYARPLAAVVGHFESEDALDVMAVARAECGDPSSCPYQAWLIRKRDGSETDAPSSNGMRLQSPIPSGYFPAGLALIAPTPGKFSFDLLKGNLRGPGQLDDALMLVRVSSGTELWQIVLPPSGTDWQEQPSVQRISAGALQALAQPAPALADMDLDSWPDLVLAVQPPDGRSAATLAVVWNESGSLVMDRAAPVDLGGASVRGFQPAKVFGGVRLVAVTDQGTVEVPANAQRRLEARPIDRLSAGEAVAVGDVTGDGLGDIVVADSGHVRVFAGVPTKP